MTRITKTIFGKLDEQEIYCFTLMNAKGNSVSIINFGGIITSWKIKDKNYSERNIVAGFDNLQDYIDDSAYFGCIAGRYANRIVNGRFSFNGDSYELSRNDGDNHLHGGKRGFGKRTWDASITERENPVLSLHYFSADGEEGYPGNLNVKIEYSYTEDDELLIGYYAETDKPTPVNLTSHCYFNLTGNVNKGILNHSLLINADQYTPVNESLVPTGELKPVNKTAFDFREQTRISDNINNEPDCYDHNFVLNKTDERFSFAASLFDPENKIELSIFTTEPGLQLYTGVQLDGTIINRDGKPLNKYAALCLETQHFPDSPNLPHFPSTILMPGEKYFSKTVYKIITDPTST